MTLAIRWGIPVAVIAACVGYLIYSASGGSNEYYLTVSELRSHGPNGDVRVAGVVQDDVLKTDGGLHVTFTEKDGTATMPVEYSGALPDIIATMPAAQALPCALAADAAFGICPAMQASPIT